MLSVIITSLSAVLLLGGYRLLWRHRYGAKRIDGLFVRVQGRIAGTAGEVVLRRTDAGELLRDRGVELELGDRRQQIDLRSPWLILIGRAVRRGQTVTVDGLPSSQPCPEALYRDAAVRPALEALRVAPGAWLELRLLHLPFALASLLLVGALALPWFLREPSASTASVDPPPEAPPPEVPLDCPPGTRRFGGTIEAHCVNAAGKPHGPALTVFAPDRIRETGQHLDGERHGLWIVRHWNGSLAEEQRYDRGRRIGCWQSYLEDGKIRRSWCFRDGLSHGTFARWTTRGQLVERGTHHDDKKHGLWQTWSDDGTLRTEGQHRGGQRHGLWRFWNADGGREARGSYRAGLHDGLWSFWHPTGKLSGRGRYRGGIKEGRWTAYYPSGRLAAVATYRKGKRTRLQIWREEEWLAAR